jgi:hypothetical protein
MFTNQELTDMIKIIDSFAHYFDDVTSLRAARMKLVKMQREQKEG